MRYFGESNVPGAPGNFLAGGNFMGGQGSAINPGAFKKDARQQKIYNKGVGTDNPNEREIFLQRTGPQLPFAGFPGAIGNMGGLMAQSSPFQGDTTNMGPAPGDYSNMPVIPDEVGDQLDRDALMEQYRNNAFPQMQNNFIPPQIMSQGIPPGFVGKQVS